MPPRSRAAKAIVSPDATDPDATDDDDDADADADAEAFLGAVQANIHKLISVADEFYSPANVVKMPNAVPLLVFGGLTHGLSPAPVPAADTPNAPDTLATATDADNADNADNKWPKPGNYGIKSVARRKGAYQWENTAIAKSVKERHAGLSLGGKTKIKVEVDCPSEVPGSILCLALENDIILVLNGDNELYGKHRNYPLSPFLAAVKPVFDALTGDTPTARLHDFVARRLEGLLPMLLRVADELETHRFKTTSRQMNRGMDADELALWSKTIAPIPAASAGTSAGTKSGTKRSRSSNGPSRNVRARVTASGNPSISSLSKSHAATVADTAATTPVKAVAEPEPAKAVAEPAKAAVEPVKAVAEPEPVKAVAEPVKAAAVEPESSTRDGRVLKLC